MRYSRKEGSELRLKLVWGGGRLAVRHPVSSHAALRGRSVLLIHQQFLGRGERGRDGGGVVDKETKRRRGKRGLQKKSAIDLADDTNVYCLCVDYKSVTTVLFVCIQYMLTM